MRGNPARDGPGNIPRGAVEVLLTLKADLQSNLGICENNNAPRAQRPLAASYSRQTVLHPVNTRCKLIQENNLRREIAFRF